MPRLPPSVATKRPLCATLAAVGGHDYPPADARTRRRCRLTETIKYSGAEQLDAYFEMCAKHNNAEHDMLVRVSSPGSLCVNVVMDYIWEIVIVILESPLCSRSLSPAPPTDAVAKKTAACAAAPAKPAGCPPLRMKLDVTAKKLDVFAPRDASSQLGFGLNVEDVSVCATAASALHTHLLIWQAVTSLVQVINYFVPVIDQEDGDDFDANALGLSDRLEAKVHALVQRSARVVRVARAFFCVQQMMSTEIFFVTQGGKRVAIRDPNNEVVTAPHPNLTTRTSHNHSCAPGAIICTV